MNKLLQWLFDAFGTSIIGRLLASTLIGVLLFFLFGLRGRDGAIGGTLIQWTIAGGTLGFVAASILAGPRVFFGSILTLFGFLLVALPISNAGNEELLMAYTIKTAVGFGLLIPGTLLLRGAIIRRRLRAQQMVEAAGQDAKNQEA